MIDAYICILYLQKQLSNYYSEKMLDMGLMCSFVIKRLEKKIKAMWYDLSSYAPELGLKSLGRILKKYLYKYKKLIFRKVAVLGSVILLKTVFSS